MGQYKQRVAYTADNYYRWPGSGTWNQGLQLGNTTWGGHNGFVRFRNVDIAQGTTITSAYITLSRWYTGTLALKNRIHGIDEDNTADLTSDATGRATTTAYVDWNPSSSWTADVEQTSGDIKTIIQEIVDRGGWSSGNAIALRFDDNGGTAGNYGVMTSYTSAGTVYPQLTINYSGTSPSSSQSPSSSVSLSPSLSPSSSISFSPSASPSPMPPFFGLRVAKQGKSAFMTDSPRDLIFDSRFGTLKYFSKQTLSFNFDASGGNVTGRDTYTHSLNYYPFVEVFVSVYIGSPTGVYEYCPFAGSGTSVTYNAYYKVTTTDITVYGEISGVSTSVWNFDFLIFIYKNDLKLN